MARVGGAFRGNDPVMKEAESRGRVRWWVYAAVWVPLVTIYVAGFIFGGASAGFALRGAIANLLPAALLGTLLVQLPRRLPWPEATRTRFFGIQAGILCGFIIVSALGWAALVLIDQYAFGTGSSLKIDLRFLPFRVLNDLLIYLTFTGLGYAWRNAERGRELAARAAKADALRARAELEAMRSQLNPHFILNTFHALVGLVRRDPALAEEALQQLGDLLRYSLRIQRESLDEVALEEELSFVASYLELERLRLGERLRVSVDVDPAAVRCGVPTFAVQTLVENSIRHAIAPRAAGGSLTVTASREGARLRIAVADEGTGASAPPPPDGQGIGLRLLTERLAALYDGAASLSFERCAGGLRALLDLPVRPMPEDE